MRACSILITNFTGPITDDNPRKHTERLFNHFMISPGITCENEMFGALVEFGKIIKIPKKNKIVNEDYFTAARILGDYYKLWAYDAIDAFFGATM